MENATRDGLIEKGADINAKDNWRRTALIRHVMLVYTEIAMAPRAR
jgi:hypothetical protein